MQNFKPGLTQYFVSNFIDDKKDQIIIKRHKNRNEYFKVDNYWVRNFGKEHVEIRDLNNFYEDTEYKQLISNEVNNAKLDFANISSENFTFENIVVVSDGFNFELIEFEIITIFSIFSSFTILKISFILLIFVENIFLFIKRLLLEKKKFTLKVDATFCEFKKSIIESPDPITDTFFFLKLL